MKYQKQWHEYNQWCKQHHMPKVSYVEFVDITFGKKQKLTGVPLAPASYRRDTPNYKSAPGLAGDPSLTAKKESQKYTGTLVKGISTMHKSNAVPVISDQESEDIARMRR